jgi:hypothetical protein
MAVRRALLAPALGVAWLSAGCGDSGKSDGQIPPSPEAQSVAQAIAKSYSENMAKKYAKQTKRSP